MKRHALPFFAGALFAVGLGVSGMTKPSKVRGFLDVTGAWDASLAFVMVGGILVYALAFHLIRKRSAPYFETRFFVPARRDIDAKLVAGAAIFGVGWGLGGFCPGPALVAAGSGGKTALVFVGAMTVGVMVAHLLEGFIAPKSTGSDAESPISRSTPP